MSKYFQTLSRLQKTTQGLPRDPFEGDQAESVPSTSSAAPLQVVQSTGHPALRRSAAFSALLDSLRGFASVADAPCIVIASVGHSESAEPVVAGVVEQALSRGLKIQVGEIAQTGDGRVLRAQGSRTKGTLLMNESEVTLSGRPPAEVLKLWLEKSEGTTDLVLIKGPPLLDSADSALVGSVTAGLMLVVTPLMTTRESLVKSVRKAKSAKCPVLGLVLSGSKQALPRWIGRVLGDSSRS